MRKALVCSLVLHLAVVALAYLGVPMAQKDIVAGSDAVAVDVVAVADTTNLPPPRPAREPAKAAPADPKPQVQKPQVQPPPKAASKPQLPPKPETVKPQAVKPETVKKEAPPQEVKPSVPPAPAPVAKPQQVTKAEPQPPKPAPPQPTPVPDSQPASANLKPAPPPKPVQHQKPDQPAPVVAAKSAPATAPGKAKPASEAKPAADFQSVLKAVETLKGSEPRKPSAEEPAPKKAEDKAASPQADAKGAQPASAEKEMDALIGQTFGSGTTTAVAASSSQMYDPGQPMSVSEIDEVRRQIEKCWNIPAGARDAGDHVVTIRVEMSPDATPRSAVVVNKVSTQVNTFQQAAAESALRAVLNPRCHPFRLPREKYERWKTMTLVFNPKDMLGT